MYAGVARAAVLILRFGERVGGWRELYAISLTSEVAATVVAFETKRKDLRTLEQAGVHTAVREVATAAAIDTNSGMFKNEGPAFIDMAFEARLLILQAVCHHAGPRTHFPGWSVGTVRVVAIRALHESFIDPMLDRHGKLRPDVGMAAITEISLRLGQKLPGRGSFVDRVAVGANHVGGSVRAAADVRTAQLLRMAAQTVVEYLLGGQKGEGDDLRLVAFRFRMSLAGAVTTLATLLFQLDFFIGESF